MIKLSRKLYVIVTTIVLPICLLLLCGKAIQFIVTTSPNVIFIITTYNITLFAFFANIPMFLYVFVFPVNSIKEKIEDILTWHNATIMKSWYVICIACCIISIICDINHFAYTKDNLIFTLFSNNYHVTN